MSDVDKRKEEFRKRMIHNKIESVLRTMRSNGITIEDLQSHTVVSQEELLKQRRAEQAFKNKSRESLVKARQVKASKTKGDTK